MNIANALIVLKLNRIWQPVGFATVEKSIVDLAAGFACHALNIDYVLDDDGNPNFDQPSTMFAVDWDEWITLPVRPWDLVVHSPSITIRVPTVLIAKNFDRMPWVRFGGRPNFSQIWKRDEGVDQYTGRKLEEREASIDHVIPRSRGGRNGWNNLVLTHKHINYRKGNRLNGEAGLKLIRKPTAPRPVPISQTIQEARHQDWRHFLTKK